MRHDDILQILTDPENQPNQWGIDVGDLVSLFWEVQHVAQEHGEPDHAPHRLWADYAGIAAVLASALVSYQKVQP